MTFATECAETTITTCMQLKGGLFPLTTLQILNNDLQAIEEQLTAKIEQAPNFFNNAPIVIDLYHLSKDDLPANIDTRIDFFALRHILMNKNLIPVGVKNANKQQQQHAIDANLAILRSNNNFENHSKHPGPNSGNKNSNLQTNNLNLNEENAKNAEAKLPKNKLISIPVRSGQQIYAPDGDITVIGSVSHGSELLADGSVHVYGALRGRALAGINNNSNARIFCNSLEADLISIAGQFKISENIDPKFWKKQVQIYLLDGKLEISEFLWYILIKNNYFLIIVLIIISNLVLNQFI